MPETTRRANALKSKVRSGVEHVFAVQKDKMDLFIRTVGIARAKGRPVTAPSGPYAAAERRDPAPRNLVTQSAFLRKDPLLESPRWWMVVGPSTSVCPIGSKSHLDRFDLHVLDVRPFSLLRQ
jgi:hypothetical protein